jgi:hypothetical protein
MRASRRGPDSLGYAAPPEPTLPMTKNHPHPHFDDRGTLDWQTAWDDAAEIARRDGKRIFIEFGRAA